MPAHRGVEHHRAGPHLPVGADALRPTNEIETEDPAAGAPVPRCLTCGMPSREGSELLTVELVPVGPWPLWLERLFRALSRRRLFYRLCPECVVHANRTTPQEADPLAVTSA